MNKRIMIVVLRLGHRHGRDARISTHVGLVARAFGAERIIYTGEHDENMMQSVKEIRERWGGEFEVKYEKNWRKVIQSFKGKVLHAAMYGENLPDVINKIRKFHKSGKNIMIIVGSQKVEREVYKMADMNVAVGNTPHSEVAALAIILHEIFKGKELKRKFKDAKLRIIPSKSDKLVKVIQ